MRDHSIEWDIKIYLNEMTQEERKEFIDSLHESFCNLCWVKLEEDDDGNVQQCYCDPAYDAD